MTDRQRTPTYKEQKAMMQLLPARTPWFPALIATEAVVLAVLLGHLAYALVMWFRLPETIITHWNLAGQPDGWGSKNTFLFLLAVAVSLYLLIVILSRFPRLWNYPCPITPDNALPICRISALLLAATNLFCQLCFLYLTWAIVSQRSVGWWFLPLLALAFVGLFVWSWRRMKQA